MVAEEFNAVGISVPLDLKRLADLAGIVPEYEDIARVVHVTSDETMRTLLSAMGIAAGTEEEISASLRVIEDRPWLQPLPDVKVFHQSKEGHEKKETAEIELCQPLKQAGKSIVLELETEDGLREEYECLLEPSRITQTRAIGGEEKAMFRVALDMPGATGFHNLSIKGDKQNKKMSFIIAPSKAYQPDTLLQGKPVWGVSTMVYELVSSRNWGMGDFRDLKEMVVEAAAKGASTVGINPIHAVPGFQASPYSPSSRIFKNPVYIAIDEIPGYGDSLEMREFLVNHKNELEVLRRSEEINVAGVYKLKTEAFEILYSHLIHSGGGEKDEFEQFMSSGGPSLEDFAVFQALREQYNGKVWQQWDVDYSDLSSEAVRRFAEENRERVNFFKYQQWLIDRQLAEVAATAREAGLDYGIYGDLAVGMNPCGADACMFRGSATQGSSIGAPPDPLGPLGQNWELCVFTPQGLREQKYRPIIEMMNASMRHNGILRSDHAMNLMRLFCIPANRSAGEGAYVRYDMDDLLGIVKILSHRNKCLIVGEDLGTVPEGFREKMCESGILSYRVQWFERDSERLKAPEEYPELALACVETHDMAPLRAYWTEADIDERKQLGLYGTEEDEAGHRNSRKEERRLMLQALQNAGLLPDGYTQANPDVPYSLELAAAIHRLTASSKSHLVMISAADLDLSVKSQNVPGTSDEMRPANWRQKLGGTPREIMQSPLLARILPDLEKRHNSIKAQATVNGPNALSSCNPETPCLT